MKGFFELKTASDLLRKLKHDLEQLKKNPRDVYCAFNFFVTAEHMLDGSYPRQKNRQNNLKKCSVYLLICSHLANGAKHFEVDPNRHKSAADAKSTGSYWPEGYFSSNYFPQNYWPKGRLVMQLQGSAERQLGKQISVIELAEKVFQFWATEFEPKKRNHTA